MFKTPSFWHRRNLVAYCLSPFSAIFRVIVTLRRLLYRYGLKKTTHFKVPVIIVGNITVGGTGKTPLVIALADLLQQQGLKPAIVSRGHGGHSAYYPYLVNPNDDAARVGDEALLLARYTHCPVAIDPNRINAVKKILAETDCNIIVSDDGLQHYALGRTVEIAVIDGERGLGNGFCLPAGPLREPCSRLKEVDFVIINGNSSTPLSFPHSNLSFPRTRESRLVLNIAKDLDSRVRGNDNWLNMQLIPGNFQQLKNPNIHQSADYFKNQTIHAVAGIGNSDRFFKSLRSMGLTIIEHPFPDHHAFTKADFNFADKNPIIMTEKDAVKCQPFANERFWYLPIKAHLDQDVNRKILSLLLYKK